MADCLSIIRQIDTLKGSATRLTAKIEQSDKEVEEAEAYLLENGYDPNELDAEIETATIRRDEKAAALEADVAELAGFINSGLEALK